MKKLLIAGIAAAAFCSVPALAADMPTKAPIYKATPLYSWTGFYVGGNVGYGWNSNTDNAFAFDVFQTGLTGPLGILNTGQNSNFNGVIGGAQIGYNWQVGNFVYGVETDFQGSGQKGTQNFNDQFILVQGLGVGVVDPTSITNTVTINWFGTTRGRIGYATDRWLVYATGGLAYGGVKVDGVALPAQAFPAAPVNPPIVWNGSRTRFGWTIGGGVEAALTGNWTWKIEYLYVDLGSITTATAFGPGCVGSGGACAPTSGGTGSITTKVRDNIVRLGVNYRYN